MSYIAVLEAVRARLEGNDPKFVPSYPSSEMLQKRRQEQPTRTSPVKGGSAKVPTSFNSSASTKLVGATRGVTFDVPIYEFDIEGRYYKQVYASLTYEVIDYVPRYMEFVWSKDDYGGDVYQHELTQSAESVIDEDGEDLGKSPRLVRQREVEHPFDIVVEIRAYAQDMVQSALLVQYVYEQFEPRGFIRVPMKDGTYRSWDMLFLSYVDLDKRQAVEEGIPEMEREYAKVWTYAVEGYLDNTDRTRLVHRTRQRVITQQRTEEA